MEQEEIEKIVDRFRDSICDVSDEEVAEVLELCRRKTELAGKERDYIGLLLSDELRRYCFRRSVNMISSTRISVKEDCRGCVACV